jgi:hypothetical protein
MLRRFTQGKLKEPVVPEEETSTFYAVMWSYTGLRNSSLAWAAVSRQTPVLIVFCPLFQLNVYSSNNKNNGCLAMYAADESSNSPWGWCFWCYLCLCISLLLWAGKRNTFRLISSPWQTLPCVIVLANWCPMCTVAAQFTCKAQTVFANKMQNNQCSDAYDVHQR